MKRNVSKFFKAGLSLLMMFGSVGVSPVQAEELSSEVNFDDEQPVIENQIDIEATEENYAPVEDEDKVIEGAAEVYVEEPETTAPAEETSDIIEPTQDPEMIPEESATPEVTAAPEETSVPEETELPEKDDELEEEIPQALLDLIAAEDEKVADENGEYDLSDADDFSDAIVEKGLLTFGPLMKAAKKVTSSTVEPKVNGFQYVATYTGTAPFDSGSGWNASSDAGKDFAQKDNVVRSYDEVVYRVAYSTYTDELETQVTDGSFYFEVTLPYLSDVGEFDLESMQWLMDPEITVSGGKQILTGHIDFNGGVVAPRIGIVNFSVLIHEHTNGTVLDKPSFKMSLKSDMSGAKTAVGDTNITVSAAPEIDAGIKYLGQDDDGKPYWGVLVSLRHSVAGRGIKGQGLLNPDSDIVIDITFPEGQNVSYYDTKFNNTQQRGYSGLLARDYFTKALPFDYGSLREEVLYDTVYHGGLVAGESPAANTVRLTLTGTEFADLLSGKATHNASADKDSGQVYTDDIYPIAAVILQTTKPGGSGDVVATITSVSHTLETGTTLSDAVASNNVATYKRTGPGVTYHGDYGWGPLSVLSATNQTTGRFVDPDESYDYQPGYMNVKAGDLVSLYAHYWTESAFAVDHGGIQSETGFVKFNADMFDPVPGKNTPSAMLEVATNGVDSQTTPAIQDYITVYFVAKANGQNWASEAEMADAHIDGTYNSNVKSIEQITADGNYILYPTADEIIASGKKAVGFYFVITDVNETAQANLAMPGAYAFSTQVHLPVLVVKDSFQNAAGGGLKAMDDPNRVSVALFDSTIVGLDGQTNRNFSQSAIPSISYGTGVGGAAQLDGDSTYAYRKATFNANGEEVNYPTNTNHWYPFETANWLHLSPMDGGMSFYMLRESAYLNFKIADTFENAVTGNIEKKKVYNLDANERTVNLVADVGTTSAGSYPQATEDYTVLLTIPNGVYPVGTGTIAKQYNVTFGSEKAATPQQTSVWQNMISQSSWLGTTPTYAVGWDEPTHSIKVTFTGAPIGWAMPSINYQVHLGTEDNPSTDLKNYQNIDYSAHLDTRTTASNLDAFDGMSVVRLGGATVVKEAMNAKRSQAHPEVGFDIHFKDEALQMAAVDAPVAMIDILPYNDQAKGANALNPGLNLGEYKIKGFNITGNITKNNSGKNPVLEVYYSTAAPATLETASALKNSNDPYTFNSSNWTKITLSAASNGDPLTDNSLVSKLNAVNGKKITAIGFLLTNAGPNSSIDVHFEYDFSGLDLVNRLKVMYGSDLYNRVKVAGGTDIRTETYSDAKTEHTPTAIIFYREVKTEVQLWHYAVVEGAVGESFSVNSPTIEGYTISSDEDKTITGKLTNNVQVFTVYYEKDPMLAQQVAVYKSASPVGRTVTPAGTTITYTLRAKNTGVAKSEVVHIKDEIPVGTTYVDGSASNGGTFSNGAVTWDLAGLNPNQETTVTFKVKVNNGFNSIVYNKAFYHIGNEAAERETNEVYHPATVETDLQGPAALSLVKSGTVVSTHSDTGTASQSWSNDATWTAPKTGSYTFTLNGAQGGTGDAAGTKGAKVVTTAMQLNAGDTVKIVVGKQGGSSKYVTYTNQTVAWVGGSMGSYSQDADSVKEGQWATIPNNYLVEGIYLEGRSDAGGARTVYGWIGTKANIYDIADGSDARPKSPTSYVWGQSLSVANASTNSKTWYQTPTNWGGNGTRCKINGNSGYHKCTIYISAYKLARSGGTGTGGAGDTKGTTHSYGGGGGGSTAIYVNGTKKAVAAGGAGGTLTNPGNQSGDWWKSGAGGGTSSGGTVTTNSQSGNGNVSVSYTWNDVTTVTDPTQIQNTDKTTSIITYTLNLVNNGNETSHGTIVTDEIPAGTKFVAGSANNGGTLNSSKNRVQWWIGDLAPGATKTLQFKVQIDNPVTRYLIANQARFGRDYTNAQLNNVTPKHASNIVEMLIPGYITVAKQWVGDENATNMRPSSVSVTVKGSNGTTKTATLNAGNNWQYTFKDLPFMTAQQKAITYTTWETTAIPGYVTSASSSKPLTIPSSGTATITNTYIAKKITVNKTWDDDGETSMRPASITFRLTGSDGTSRTGTMTLPATSYTFENLPVYASNGSLVTYQVWEDNIDDYDSDHSSASKISVAGGTNNATVGIKNTLVRDFPIAKTVTDANGTDINNKTVSVGANLYYHITVENPYSGARFFDITDDLPANTSFVSADNAGSLSGSTVKWGKISVPAKGSKTVSFVVKTTAANKVIPNIATGAIYKSDGLTVSITKETNRVVNYTPGITKSVKDAKNADINTKSVEPGQTIHYEIKVDNPAPAAKSYTITDVLDTANLTFVSADNGGTNANGTVTWNVSVPANGSKTVTVFVKVKENKNTEIKNKATTTVELATATSNEVVNWKGYIDISKAITNYYSEYGTPFFTFEIKDTNGNVWYRDIELSDATRNGAAQTFYVPKGLAEAGMKYTVKEVRNARYELVTATAGTNMTVASNIGTTTISKAKPAGSVSFTDTIQKWNKDSHADAAVNSFGK